MATPIRICARPVGGTVEIDGRPAPNVRAANLSLAAGEATRLVVELVDVSVDVDGDATVERVAPIDAADMVRALDPDQVRGLVAQRVTGFGDDMYAAALSVVADMLDQSGPP